MQSHTQTSLATDLSTREWAAETLGDRAVQQLGHGWTRVSRTLPSDAGADEYCRANNLSRECLVAAAWSQVLGCYTGGEDVLPSISVQHPGADRRLAADLWPTVSSDPVILDWLKCIDRALWTLPQDAEIPRERDFIPASPFHQLKGTNSLLAVSSSHYGMAPGQALRSARARKNTILVEAALDTETSLSICYPNDHFSIQLAEILVDCLAHVFAQLPGNGSKQLSALSLVPPDLYPGSSPSPRYLSMSAPRHHAHELIEQQCRRNPKQIAGICDGVTITYGELNAKSNQLARCLKKKGCGPEVLVAVHMARSLDLLVAILGVLKSGAAFVPLDALLPTGRIHSVIEDCSAAIVITTSSLASRFDNCAIEVLPIDGAPCPWSSGSANALDARVAPENLAYVIYTSGSTGKPKGVMIEHQNLASFLTALDEVLGSEPGVWLATASISFDISIIELIWTLARGFQIVLHQGDGGIPLLLGPGSVPEQMIRYGVTHVAGTPTLMRMLAGGELAPAAFGNLRICFVGGEAFPSSLAPLLLELVSRGSVINAYGPTEITVAATYHRIDSPTRTVSIGKALSNASLHVVDYWQRLLPPLAAGELVIGGSGVGRGYINRPELTGVRFVPNIYDQANNQKLYRSGDLVYADLSGDLFFIDRLDSQVKIRGYRIELGEIEAVLIGHPEVLEAAVLVKEDAAHGKSLVGFYRLRDQSRIDSACLRKYLKETLPSYMVPPVMHRLEYFPVTSSGKLDRSALANAAISESAEREEAADGGSPTSAVEAELCSWFEELLQVPSVRPTDDFFELGGQSIVAAQLMTRVAARFGVNLRLSVLVESRCARALMKKIAEAKEQNTSSWSPVIPIRQQGSKPPLFIIAGLGGNIVNFEFVAGKISDRPVYGVETYGLNAQADVLLSVEDMARAYLEEIRRIQPVGPYHLAGYSFGGILAFEMAQQLRSVGLQVGLLGLVDTVEWHYAARVISELSFWDSWNLHYGQTINQIVAGPDRRKTLVKRLNTFWEHRSFAFQRWAGRKQKSDSGGSPEQRNYAAARHYIPKPYGGEVHLFRCPEKSLRRGNDPLLGWGTLCKLLKVTEIEGEHEQITAEPFASYLSLALRCSLNSVEPCSVSALTELQTALDAF